MIQLCRNVINDNGIVCWQQFSWKWANKLHGSVLFCSKTKRTSIILIKMLTSMEMPALLQMQMKNKSFS